MASSLSVLICHGFYSTPELYQPLIEMFRSHDFEAHCPQLPTSDLSKLNVGDLANPDFDLDPPPGGYPQGKDDAEVVTRELHSLIEDQGKRVLLLAHSAGGWVATQCAAPHLQEKVRQKEGLAGGIIGILYFAAFIIPVGESIHSAFQPKDGSIHIPPWLSVHVSICHIDLLTLLTRNSLEKNGLMRLKNPVHDFFHDLSTEDAQDCAELLTASPVDVTVLTNDAYAALPSAYLVCDGDRMLPKEYQESMVEAQVAKTGRFRMHHCEAGHAPHLSWTKGVLDAAFGLFMDIESGIYSR
jgi:pimeloyl-ACP methyl ester carboxylesterase